MIWWWSANIKITWNADQSNMINDQLITWQNGQIIADHAAWAHVNIVKWPQLAKFKKFRTCNGVLNSGLDPDPEKVLICKSWIHSSDHMTKWRVDQMISDHMTTGGAREPFTTLITFGLLAHASELVLQFVYFEEREVPVIPVERSPASLSSSWDSWGGTAVNRGPLRLRLVVAE